MRTCTRESKVGKRTCARPRPTINMPPTTKTDTGRDIYKRISGSNIPPFLFECQTTELSFRSPPRILPKTQPTVIPRVSRPTPAEVKLYGGRTTVESTTETMTENQAISAP